MRRHGNSRSLGVFPPSIFVKSLMFLSTRTLSDRKETKVENVGYIVQVAERGSSNFACYW